MAKTVRANQRLTSGGLVATKREISTSREGILTYSVQYVCLTQFAQDQIFKFVIEMPPPDALPDKIFALAKDYPVLHSVNIKEERGITYFDCVYSTASNVNVVVTDSEETKSAVFSEGEVSVTFDFVSKTVSVSATNTYPDPESGDCGPPFNVKLIGDSTAAQNLYARVRKDTVETRSKSRSSNGEFSYQTDSMGTYVIV